MKVPGIPYIQGRNKYSDKDGRKYGIAIHGTANTAPDLNEAYYAQRRTDGTSSHFYVDSDSVTQSLDTDSKAGHAGSSVGNENAISVEITGLNSWRRDQWQARVAWDQLGRVLAVVCRHYGIAPRRATVDEMRRNPAVKAFYSHDDMRRAWGGTDHTDPGPNFPWDALLSNVIKHMHQNESVPTPKGKKMILIELRPPNQQPSYWVSDGVHYRTFMDYSNFEEWERILGARRVFTNEAKFKDFAGKFVSL